MWSQIKRAPKAKRKRKTYEVDGPARPEAVPLDNRARQIFEYFKKYNYEVVGTGEVITFAGTYQASKAQAAALVFYVFCGKSRVPEDAVLQSGQAGRRTTEVSSDFIKSPHNVLLLFSMLAVASFQSADLLNLHNLFCTSCSASKVYCSCTVAVLLDRKLWDDQAWPALRLYSA